MFFLLFALAIVCLYFYRNKKIIIDLPIIFLVAEILLPWFHGGKTDWATTQQVRMIYFSSIFSLFIFVFHFNLITKKNAYYLITALFFLIIVLFRSTVFFESFKKYLKIAPALLAFPVYYQYFRSKPQDFPKFYKRLVIYNAIFVLPIVVSSVFKISI